MCFSEPTNVSQTTGRWHSIRITRQPSVILRSRTRLADAIRLPVSNPLFIFELLPGGREVASDIQRRRLAGVLLRCAHGIRTVLFPPGSLSARRAGALCHLAARHVFVPA